MSNPFSPQSRELMLAFVGQLGLDGEPLYCPQDCADAGLMLAAAVFIWNIDVPSKTMKDRIKAEVNMYEMASVASAAMQSVMEEKIKQFAEGN